MQKAELDSGTILYIVIAVIAGIASIVQKKKKPEAHVPETHETTDVPKHPWEDVLTDTFDMPEPKPAPTPKPFVQSVQPTVRKKHTIENSFITSKAHLEKIENEGIASTDDDFDIKSGEIGSSTESLSRPKIDFDLRKAVIYSEVLNRKY